MKKFFAFILSFTFVIAASHSLLFAKTAGELTLYGIKFGDSAEDAEKKLREINPNFQFYSSPESLELYAVEPFLKWDKIESIKNEKDKIKEVVVVAFLEDKTIWYVGLEKYYPKNNYPLFKKLIEELFLRYGDDPKYDSYDNDFFWEYDKNGNSLSSDSVGRISNCLGSSYFNRPFLERIFIPEISGNCAYIVKAKIKNPVNYVTSKSGRDLAFVSSYHIFMFDALTPIAYKKKKDEEQGKRSMEIKGDF
jgi:hypothetical protein